MPNFRDYDQEQTVYRQLVPAQLLEDDHPARIVSAVLSKCWILNGFTPGTKMKENRPTICG